MTRSLAIRLLLPPLPPSSHFRLTHRSSPADFPPPKLLLYHSPKVQQYLPRNPQVTLTSKANAGLHLSLRSSEFNAPVSPLYCLYHLLFRRLPALASLHSFPIPYGLSRHWWKTLLSSLVGTPSQQFILVHPHSRVLSAPGTQEHILSLTPRVPEDFPIT